LNSIILEVQSTVQKVGEISDAQVQMNKRMALHDKTINWIEEWKSKFGDIDLKAIQATINSHDKRINYNLKKIEGLNDRIDKTNDNVQKNKEDIEIRLANTKTELNGSIKSTAMELTNKIDDGVSELRNYNSIQDRRIDDLKNKDFELFEMLKRTRERIEKLTADLRKLKEDSENLDLTI